jgi:hypothetical protein
MSAKLLSQIELGIEREKLSAELVRQALASTDINTRGIGFEVFSAEHLRAYLGKFTAVAGDPMACLRYLLDCVLADLDWDEDYALSREDALWELRAPLDPFWAAAGVAIEGSAYWAAITQVLQTQSEPIEGVAAQFLAECPQDSAFLGAMTAWKAHPVLQVYVADLERILSTTFD